MPDDIDLDEQVHEGEDKLPFSKAEFGAEEDDLLEDAPAAPLDEDDLDEEEPF